MVGLAYGGFRTLKMTQLVVQGSVVDLAYQLLEAFICGVVAKHVLAMCCSGGCMAAVRFFRRRIDPPGIGQVFPVFDACATQLRRI